MSAWSLYDPGPARVQQVGLEAEQRTHSLAGARRELRRELRAMPRGFKIGEGAEQFVVLCNAVETAKCVGSQSSIVKIHSGIGTAGAAGATRVQDTAWRCECYKRRAHRRRAERLARGREKLFWRQALRIGENAWVSAQCAGASTPLCVFTRCAAALHQLHRSTARSERKQQVFGLQAQHPFADLN